MEISDYELFAVPPRWLFLRLETSAGIHYNEKAGVGTYLASPELAVEDDFLHVPDGPGMGVEVVADVVRERAGEPEWHNPVPRHEAGSVAEW